MRLWSRELWRIIWLAFLGMCLGWLLGYPGFGLAAGLTLCLVYQLRQLRALFKWLTLNPHDEPPAATGMWGELFDRLYRYQKSQRITQSRLRATLARIQESSEAMRDSVVMLDRHGDLEWWNSAATDMLGLQTAHDRGQHITNLLRDPRFISYFNAREYSEPLTLTSPIDERRILQYQITLYGDDERLVMARDITRLHRLEQMRRDFVANVSHELRTPLAVLRGEIEAMQDGIRPLNQENLSSLAQEVAQLERLVADLRLLSQSDAGALDIQLAPMNLSESLESRLNDADRWLEESGLTLTTALADDVMIRGDAQRLRQLWSNLLDNSCAYTQPPGKLSVSLICERGDAVITWQDSAPGVPEEELSRLTERLYRVEGSRNRASGGSGLGLSIASALVTAHGGTLTPSASALGGLTWTLRLPLLTAS